MIASIDLDRQIIQKQGNVISNMDGETVMLNVQKGKYYNLGAVGGRIWGLMADPVSANQLVVALTNEYDVEQIECEQQVVSFLKRLFEEGLICYVEGQDHESY